MFKFVFLVCAFAVCSHALSPKKLSIGAKCDPSVTTASGSSAPTGVICPGDLIFEDNFNSLSNAVWEHENTLGGGGVSRCILFTCYLLLRSDK